MFDAKNIDFTTLEADPEDGLNEGTSMGRGFAVGGGVAAAVVEAIKHIDPTREVQIEYGDSCGVQEDADDGQGRKAQRLSAGGHGLPRRLRGRRRHITPVKKSTAAVTKYVNDATVKSVSESAAVKRLHEVQE